MSDYQTNATVTVNVNGKDAENKLAKLRTRAEDLKNAIAKAGADGDKANQEKFRKELRKTTKEIRLMESSSAEVERVMKNLSKATPKELQRTLKQLNKELNSMERGSKAWDAQRNKIKSVRAEIESVNSSLRKNESLFSRINRKLNDWGMTIAAVVASLTGIVFSARQATTAFIDMDSELANTRKFTGMTEKDVASLNEEFKKMDTRSSREQLNQMAQSAGRLGKDTQKSVMEFVRAANIVGVAMDELGADAPQIIAQLAGVFNIDQELGTERAMLAVGSAINTLSQNCAAGAPNLVDFSSRLGAIAAQTGMTMDEMLAFGAVLDANRVSVEKSATAVQSVLSKMMAHPEDFAKKAGMNVTEFTNAINKSSTDALLMFVNQLSKLDKLGIAKILADLKVQDSGVIQTFNTLAGKVAVLNKQLEVSKKAFNEASSATEEYNVQNNTEAAILDKTKKQFKERVILLGEKLLPLMKYAVTSSSAMMRVLSVLVDFVSKNAGAIIALTSAIAMYNLTLKANNILTNIHYGLLVLQKGALVNLKAAYLTMAGVYNLLTLQLGKMRAAFRLLNITMKSNLIGIVITALTVVIYKIVKAVREVDALSAAQKRLTKYTADFQTQLSQETEQIDKLFGALDAAKKGTQGYEDAKKNIIDQYGQYLTGLGKEVESLNDVAGAYKAVKEEAEKAARARALASARKGEEDEYYKILGESSKEVAEGLKDVTYKYENTERALTSREQQKWLQKLIAEAESGHFSRESKTFLNRIGVHFTDDGSMRGPNGVVSLGKIIKAKRSKDFGDAVINSAFGVPEDLYMGLSREDMVEVIQGLSNVMAQMKSSGKNGRLTLQNGKSVIFESIADVMAELTSARGHLSNLNNNAGLLPELTVTGNTAFSGTASNIDGSFAMGNADDNLRKDYERQIAEAKTAYAIGETTYRAYQADLLLIESDYLEKRLETQRMDATERAKLEAELAETNKKGYEFAMQTSREDLRLDYEQKQKMLTSQYAENLISESSYHEQQFRAEIDYLEKLKETYSLNYEEKSKIEQQIEDKLMDEKLRKKKDFEQKVKTLESEFFGMTQLEKDSQYQQELSALEYLYQQQMAMAEGNAEEKLRIEKAYQEALKALILKYTQPGSEGDIGGWAGKLGEFWETEGAQKFMQGFSTVGNAMGAMFSSFGQLAQAEFDIQTNAINDRYDKEVKAAAGNSYKIEKIEKRREAELAKAKNNASKKQFAMQIIQAVMNTAQNIVAAVGAGMQFGLAAPVMIPLLVGIATTTGAVQIAAMRKQQQAAASQGYSQGGFTKKGRVDEPAGIVHAGEWVASQKLVNNPNSRAIIDALEYAQRTNTIGSIRMDDVSANRIAQSASSATFGAMSAQMSAELGVVATLYNSISRLNDRLDKPFVTVNTVEGDHGIKQAQDEYDKLMRNKSPKRSWK